MSTSTEKFIVEMMGGLDLCLFPLWWWNCFTIDILDQGFDSEFIIEVISVIEEKTVANVFWFSEGEDLDNGDKVLLKAEGYWRGNVDW